MNVARWVVVACVVVLGACRPPPPVLPQERCESGRYLESAAACTQLAAAATSDAERTRLALIAARNQLWTCAESSPGERCDAALATLWTYATDPAEVTTVLAWSQQRCLAGDCST